MRVPSLSRTLSSAALPAALAMGLFGSAHADSGVGVDTWRANKLDPNANATMPDERGTSWLEPGEHRTPTGTLYPVPPAPPAPDRFGDWEGYGVLQIGLLGTGGDDDNALWNRYVHWDSGLILGLLDYTWQRPADGTYANVRASRLSEDDQYYQAVFGRAGAYKVQAFVRSLPNVLTANARPLWNGVGSNTLTLPTGITPGGSTPAEVAAAVAATPERTLGVKRDKQGLGFNMYLSPTWTAYANVSDEQRKGARPYGGPFFFAFAFPNDGGVLETTKPIDDSTINLSAGLRYAGSVWRLDLGYTGSFYRDANRSYTFQTPFALYTPIIPGAVSAPLTQGQMSTEPDNDYHNLKVALTRKIALDGELSVTASAGRMSQNDRLIAPIDCQGVFGIGLNGSLALGPQNPYLYNCADWNTPAALSRRTADMSIDTAMLDARVILQPTSALSLRGGITFNREDYRNAYLAYNPLTGDYGYVSENGAQGSIVPGEVGLFNPLTDPSALTRVRSLPLDKQTIQGTFGADYRFGDKSTVGATATFERYEPTNRERQRVDDGSVKFTFVNRSVEGLTLRANYTVLHQDGDRYDYDPYNFTYSNGLPGYVPPATGTPANTVDALRKYDLSNREEHKLDLMATLALRTDMTLSASLRGDLNDYDATIGRQGYDTFGATLQWEWQPAPATSMNAYVAADRSRLRIANVNELIAQGPDPTLGGQTYPVFGEWWVGDRQRNYYAGLTFNHTFRRVRFDAGWNYLYTRGTTSYSYASSLALAWADLAGGDGPGAGAFPAMIYRVNTLNLGVTVPLSPRMSVRVFDQYERGRVSDWHYLGLDALRVIGNRVYTDGGPESYSANLVGVLLSVAL